jgi:hypothetical protein
MAKRPFLFTLVPIVLLSTCASFYFQTAIVLKVSFTQYVKIISHITPSNWITMVFMILSGIVIMKASKWAKLLMPLTFAIVCWNNYLVAVKTNNFTTAQIVLAVFLFALLFAPLYNKKIQLVLSDKKHQWWLRPFRKRHKLAVRVIPHTDFPSFEATTYDVSKTGLFLILDHLLDWSHLPKIEDNVKLNVTMDDAQTFLCEARVVRLENAKGIYPRGVGFQFTTLTDEAQKNLNTLLNKKSS